MLFRSDMASNSYCQLKIKKNDLTYFSFALDESTDNTDTAQTTGFEIFNAFKKAVEDLNLPWSKLSAVTTDGAPSMIGGANGFIGYLKRHLGPDLATQLKHYHCIIHQEALCGKHLQFKDIMDFVVSAVNFICAAILVYLDSAA